MTVRDLIDRIAEAQTDSCFLISSESGQTLSYGSLRQNTKRLIAILQQSRVEKGDRVALLLDNGLAAAHLFRGAMYGGMVSVPLSVNAGQSQLVYMLDHCDAKVVFVSDEYTKLIDEVVSHLSRSFTVIPTRNGEMLHHINAECVTLLPTLLSGGSVVILGQTATPCFVYCSN